MQGDIEQRRYTTYGQATRRIIAERGVAALWSGLPFRLARQFIAVFLFDKINAELAPRLFARVCCRGEEAGCAAACEGGGAGGRGRDGGGYDVTSERVLLLKTIVPFTPHTRFSAFPAERLCTLDSYSRPPAPALMHSFLLMSPLLRTRRAAAPSIGFLLPSFFPAGERC